MDRGEFPSFEFRRDLLDSNKLWTFVIVVLYAVMGYLWSYYTIPQVQGVSQNS